MDGESGEQKDGLRCDVSTSDVTFVVLCSVCVCVCLFVSFCPVSSLLSFLTN